MLRASGRTRHTNIFISYRVSVQPQEQRTQKCNQEIGAPVERQAEGEGGGPGDVSMRHLGVTLVYEPWCADIQPGLRMLRLGDLKANLIIKRKKNV